MSGGIAVDQRRRRSRCTSSRDGGRWSTPASILTPSGTATVAGAGPRSPSSVRAPIDVSAPRLPPPRRGRRSRRPSRNTVPAPAAATRRRREARSNSLRRPARDPAPRATPLTRYGIGCGPENSRFQVLVVQTPPVRAASGPAARPTRLRKAEVTAPVRVRVMSLYTEWPRVCCAPANWSRHSSRLVVAGGSGGSHGWPPRRP